MMSLWAVSILVAAFGVILTLARPEGYGEFEPHHGHGYNAVPVVKKVVDYYSKPQYAFGYEVEDYYQQLSHGRWEIRDGDVTQGQYRVLLPDGRIQIVSYIADKGGYRPTVQYIGKGVHPPPPPPYAHVKPPKHLHVEPEIIPHNDLGHGGHIPLSGPGPTAPFVPLLAEPKPIVPVVPIGPLKLDVNPQILALIGPSGYGHGHGHGHGYGGFDQGYPGTGYGYGHGYGHGYGGHGYAAEPLAFGPSNQKSVKVAPNGRIAKKRALLYDRTLFRRDLKKPKSIPRK